MDVNDKKLLEKMCKDIEEDSLCSAKKYWNDRDTLAQHQKTTKFNLDAFSKGFAAASGGAAIIPVAEANPRLKFIAVGLLAVASTILQVWNNTINNETEVALRHTVASSY